MPGYPCDDCCPSSSSCARCDGNGTPDTVTVDLPAGVDDDCIGDCSTLIGSYSLPRVSSCTWHATFAVTDPEFDFCTRTADTLIIHATILSSSVLEVSVTIKDSTDAFNAKESWVFKLQLASPENCCAWNLLNVPYDNRASTSDPSFACDFSGTSVDVTASAGGC